MVSIRTRQVCSAHLGTFTIISLAFHTELAFCRPPPEKSASFYLWISLGGWLGGIFNAVVAPWLFNEYLEYPLVLVLSCGLLFLRNRPTVNIWDLCLPYAIGLMATLALLQTRATSMPRPEVIQTLVLCSLKIVP